jgi:protein-S-isoprenylcysteine O-methyltransferase Ste14
MSPYRNVIQPEVSTVDDDAVPAVAQPMPLSIASAVMKAVASDWLVDRRVRISFGFACATIAANIAIGFPLRESGARDKFTLVAGLLLAVAGTAIRSWAAGVLMKHEALATSGPYGLCRNPLYAGSLLLAVGFSLLLHDPFSPCLLVAPLAGLIQLTIRREERRLAARYRDAWAAYEREVPRLLPRRFRCGSANWSWRRWLKNREYWALATSVAALAALLVAM